MHGIYFGEIKDLVFKKKVSNEAKKAVNQNSCPSSDTTEGCIYNINVYSVEKYNDIDILTVVGAIVKIESQILRKPIVISLATIDSGIPINKNCIIIKNNRLKNNKINMSKTEKE